MPPCTPSRLQSKSFERKPRVTALGESTVYETYYDLMRRQGITRRSFLKFCKAGRRNVDCRGLTGCSPPSMIEVRGGAVW